MQETEIHDLSDDADYAASQQQVRPRLLRFLKKFSPIDWLIDCFVLQLIRLIVDFFFLGEILGIGEYYAKR